MLPPDKIIPSVQTKGQSGPLNLNSSLFACAFLTAHSEEMSRRNGNKASHFFQTVRNMKLSDKRLPLRNTLHALVKHILHNLLIFTDYIKNENFTQVQNIAWAP